MRLLLFASILIIPSFSMFSQQDKRFYMYAGVGSHEAIHGGMKFNYTHTSSISVGYGNFFGFIRNERYWDVFAEYERMLPIWNHRNEISTCSLQSKIMYWELNDQFYNFQVISLEPALGKRFGKSNGNYFQCDIGPVFMVVVGFKRLTFDEVGWPNNIMLNASIKYTIGL